jgi:hypothetical protein
LSAARWSIASECRQHGRELLSGYLGWQFTMKVAAIGYKPLHDPDNKLPRN